MGGELGKFRLEFGFAYRLAGALEIVADLAQDISIAGFLEIGENDALGVGLGFVPGLSKTLGDPETQQLVAACLGLEAQFLIVGELLLEGILTLVEQGHRVLSS